jgi:hypothetical protein
MKCLAVRRGNPRGYQFLRSKNKYHGYQFLRSKNKYMITIFAQQKPKKHHPENFEI